MRENKQDSGQPKRAEPMQNKEHNLKMPVRLISLCVITSTLVLSLTVMSGPGSFVQVKDAHAKGVCGILFLCPTPTPSPTPSPTSTPYPTSQPTLPPTATVSVLPTATAIPLPAGAGVGQVPAPSPTSTPTTRRGKAGNHISGQLARSEFSPMITTALFIFFCLLLILGIGLFFFRRMLLPSIDIKHIASSWASSYPEKAEDHSDIKETRINEGVATPVFAVANKNVNSSSNSFTPSQQISLSYSEEEKDIETSFQAKATLPKIPLQGLYHIAPRAPRSS